MVYTHIPFLGIPSHPGTKVISPLPFLPSLPSPPNYSPSNMTDRCKAIFLQAMGDCLEGKTPSFLSPPPLDLVLQVGKASLIAPTPPILSTQYCSLPLPPSLPSVCLSHWGVPPFPTLTILYRVHFCSESSFCPSRQPEWAFFRFSFLFFCIYCKLVCKLFYRGKKGK